MGWLFAHILPICHSEERQRRRIWCRSAISDAAPIGADAHIGPYARFPACCFFSLRWGLRPPGASSFRSCGKKRKKGTPKGRAFYKAALPFGILSSEVCFLAASNGCRARCLALLGPRNRGAAGNVGGRPTKRIGLWIRGNNPTCHSERSEESCCKFALDSSSLALLRMTNGEECARTRPTLCP